LQAHAAAAQAEEHDEIAAKARAAGEIQRVSLVTAQRAAEKSATRADRAEAEAQEVRYAATADREAAASATAATEGAQQRIASLQAQLVGRCRLTLSNPR